MVVYPMSEGDQIHLNPAAIQLMPTLHFDRQSASSILKPSITLPFSTCFFHVLFELQPQNLMLSQDMTILSPQQMNIPKNTVCHINIKSVDLLPVLHTLFSPWISLSFIKFPSHFQAPCFTTIQLALHNSCKQPISAIHEISSNTASDRTP